MIAELINMNGYGAYVWSAFSFTLFSFTILYLVIKIQYIKERKKFVFKYGTLDTKKAKIAKSHTINKEILSNIQSI